MPSLRTQRSCCFSDQDAHLTDEIVVHEVPAGSRVLDLGCGDGRLLALLRDQRQAQIQGVELNLEQLRAAMARGVPVVQTNLDSGLPGFPDELFDVAILSRTLQEVRYPRLILREMLRIARRALVIVPNFGHWRVRIQVSLRGRAPITAALPFEWYETPNLHFMSMTDFRDLVAVVGAKIVREIPIMNGRAAEGAWAANLRADSGLYVLERSA